ncbi:hypothetical protein THAOC_26327, partial [Thalassiosira oceanica]
MGALQIVMGALQIVMGALQIVMNGRITNCNAALQIVMGALQSVMRPNWVVRALTTQPQPQATRAPEQAAVKP